MYIIYITFIYIYIYIYIYIFLKQFGDVLVFYINLFIQKDSNLRKRQKNLTEETTNMVAKFLQNKVYISHW